MKTTIAKIARDICLNIKKKQMESHRKHKIEDE